MEIEILSEEQYKVPSKRLIDAIEKRHKIIPLNTLKHPKYILRKTIYITIELDKKTVIASLDDIEAFAYADTEYEAINKLCEEIINIFDDLRDAGENLGLLPQRWLEFLEEVIEIR